MDRETFIQKASARLEEIATEVDRLQRERNYLKDMRARVSIGAPVELAEAEMARHGMTFPYEPEYDANMAHEDAVPF